MTTQEITDSAVSLDDFGFDKYCILLYIKNKWTSQFQL